MFISRRGHFLQTGWRVTYFFLLALPWCVCVSSPLNPSKLALPRCLAHATRFEFSVVPLSQNPGAPLQVQNASEPCDSALPMPRSGLSRPAAGSLRQHVDDAGLLGEIRRQCFSHHNQPFLPQSWVNKLFRPAQICQAQAQALWRLWILLILEGRGKREVGRRLAFTA